MCGEKSWSVMYLPWKQDDDDQFSPQACVETRHGGALTAIPAWGARESADTWCSLTPSFAAWVNSRQVKVPVFKNMHKDWRITPVFVPFPHVHIHTWTHSTRTCTHLYKVKEWKKKAEENSLRRNERTALKAFASDSRVLRRIDFINTDVV